MKTILVKNYQCDYCNQVFNRWYECADHELKEHLCPKCEIFCYYVKNERDQFICNAKNKCKFKEIEK